MIVMGIPTQAMPKLVIVLMGNPLRGPLLFEIILTVHHTWAILTIGIPTLAMPKLVIVLVGNLLRGPLILEMVLVGQPFMCNDHNGYSSTCNA
jgi:hypothetical protein